MGKVLRDAVYNKLLSDICGLYETARMAQVRFAWETGKRIVEVEQGGRARAPYGSDLIPRLSRDLIARYGEGAGFSERTLRKMRRFYLANKIRPRAAELSLDSYLVLSQLKDERTRKGLFRRAIKEELTRNELRRLVTKINRHNGVGAGGKVPPKQLPPLKRPTDLRLGTFFRSSIPAKLVDGDVLLDCGFFTAHYFTKAELAGVTVTDAPSYTYEAMVERVIDGDTLKVIIDIPGRSVINEKLRLRGMNTPELGTPEGDRAKEYVTKLLPPGSIIVLKSHKAASDTYGRFVVDVLYLRGESDPGLIAKNGIFLNQQLVDEGYAQRVEY